MFYWLVLCLTGSRSLGSHGLPRTHYVDLGGLNSKIHLLELKVCLSHLTLVLNIWCSLVFCLICFGLLYFGFFVPQSFLGRGMS